MTDDNRNASIEIVSSSVIESQERANIDMLISTAKRYPRDLARVVDAMIRMATLDQDTAEACSYHLERSGHSIDGPSVRLAEIAVSCYQNVRSGARVVSNDGKTVTGQGYCHDLENNVFVAWETARRITGSDGRTFSEDMQVTTGNAASAIAFRNAVFKTIPGAIIKRVETEARKFAVGDIKTLTQRVTRALRKFAAIGVSEQRVLASLNHDKIDQITVADLEKLFGTFTAISEGTTTVEQAFPTAPVKPNLATKPAPVEDKEKPVKTAPAEPPPPVEPPSSPPPPYQRDVIPMIEPKPQPATQLEAFEQKLRTEFISVKEALHAGIAYGFRTKQNAVYTATDVDELKVTLRDINEQYLKIVLNDFEEFSITVQRYRRGEQIY